MLRSRSRARPACPRPERARTPPRSTGTSPPGCRRAGGGKERFPAPGGSRVPAYPRVTVAPVSMTRLETFADGVFAIAATLLVLEIQLPGDDIGQGLLDLWPSYFAYALSFLSIGIMWVNHHVVLSFTREADRIFLFINLFLLIAIAFVPFPTHLYAEHLQHEGAREAALAYGLTFVVIAIFFQLFWQYARRNLLRPDADPREVSGDQQELLARR